MLTSLPEPMYIETLPGSSTGGTPSVGRIARMYTSLPEPALGLYSVTLPIGSTGGTLLCRKDNQNVHYNN